MTNEPETGTGIPEHDPQHTGGLVESGAADIPGVQDAGPADVEEEAEGAQPFSDRPEGVDRTSAASAVRTTPEDGKI